MSSDLTSIFLSTTSFSKSLSVIRASSAWCAVSSFTELAPRYSSTSCTVMGSPSTVAMIRFTTSARPDPAGSAETIATTATTERQPPQLMAGHRLSRRSEALQERTQLCDRAVVVGGRRTHGERRSARETQPALAGSHLLQHRLYGHRRAVVELEHDGVASPACRDHAQVLEPPPQLHDLEQRVHQRRDRPVAVLQLGGDRVQVGHAADAGEALVDDEALAHVRDVALGNVRRDAELNLRLDVGLP